MSSQVSSVSSAETHIADIPLVVDIDGTLVHSDLLVESAFRSMVSLLYRITRTYGQAWPISSVNTSWYRRGELIDHRKGTSAASTNRQISRNQAAPGWSGNLMMNGLSCKRLLLGSATIS